MNKILLSACGLVSAALLATTTSPATASGGGGGGGVVKTGSCSQASQWKVKVKADNGGLEVEGEVDSNKVGQTWTWRILDNGSLAARGTARTVAPSGSFSVERLIANRAGADHVVFRATNAATGETCRGAVTF